ncbi:hypothetical protein BDN70DRAFT_254366 [Pholiota conissans]|uniref:Uncharacterized protein n=1 Tax=Pholiota conissans TaxID=109636 RepID=A0A9P5YV88_9AGAR|nr:hypothetical protein BDN70DRAFT_254366 [Pholiota conissans]
MHIFTITITLAFSTAQAWTILLSFSLCLPLCLLFFLSLPFFFFFSNFKLNCVYILHLRSSDLSFHIFIVNFDFFLVCLVCLASSAPYYIYIVLYIQLAGSSSAVFSYLFRASCRRLCTFDLSDSALNLLCNWIRYALALLFLSSFSLRMYLEGAAR